MAHFDEGSSLSPPFNIIITPKTIYYSICLIVNGIKWLFGRYHQTRSKKRATIRVSFLIFIKKNVCFFYWFKNNIKKNYYKKFFLNICRDQDIVENLKNLNRKQQFQIILIQQQI